ncbi:MAG: 5'-methylthioadenosine/adenosylhomocysteine nucleosidase, partial [Oxalobacteraceae bacterium]
HQADATEMEGAAVAQICYQQSIPCIVIRSLSDKANSSARTDMRTFLGIAARNSAQLVVSMMEASR